MFLSTLFGLAIGMAAKGLPHLKELQSLWLHHFLQPRCSSWDGVLSTRSLPDSTLYIDNSQPQWPPPGSKIWNSQSSNYWTTGFHFWPRDSFFHLANGWTILRAMPEFVSRLEHRVKRDSVVGGGPQCSVAWICQGRGTDLYGRSSWAHSFSHKGESDVFREEVTFELDFRVTFLYRKGQGCWKSVKGSLWVGINPYFMSHSWYTLFLMWCFKKNRKV